MIAAVGLSALGIAVVVAALLVSGAFAANGAVYRVARVIDGDTVELGNGQHVRFVQVDTPEVFFGVECYGKAASATTKALLPKGTRVRLQLEPASERVDRYGRLLRYVIRARDGLNVNVRLVAVGAAAPWFFEGERGRYAARLNALALRAKAQRIRVGWKQGAFGRRATIEQAEGILMARNQIDAEEAYELLKSESQRNGRKVIELAEAVITAHGLLPGEASNEAS